MAFVVGVLEETCFVLKFSDEFANLFLAYWFGLGRLGVSNERGVLMDLLRVDLAIGGSLVFVAQGRG